MAILIVDDSRDSRLLIETYLRSAGYTEIKSVGSAEAAFSLLGLKKPQQHGFSCDLILMDLVMPDMDGIEACRRIKSSEGLADVPIIIITADKDPVNLEAAFTAGAMDFISKPLNKTELRVRVRSVLKLKSETDNRKEAYLKLKHANEQLELLSSLDGLTGIANRRFFDQMYDVEWRRSQRGQSMLSVLMLDIDYFKRYNDTYGHLAGDDCLKQVAGTLSRSVNRAGDLVARYGGEEFVVLLPGIGSDKAAAVAERMRAAVEALQIPHENSEASRFVTVSIGSASVVAGGGLQPQDLVNAADEALYAAKQQGRNRYRVGSLKEPEQFDSPVEVPLLPEDDSLPAGRIGPSVVSFNTLSDALDSAQDFVFFKNLDGIYLGCNPAFAEFVGRPWSEIVGRTDHDLFSKEVADFFRQRDQLMLDSGGPQINEEWIRYPSGRSILLETNKAPLVDKQGRVYGVLGVSRDITERKLREEALKQEQDLFAAGPIVAFKWIPDSASSIESISPNVEAVLGYAPEEFVQGRVRFDQIVHPDDFAELVARTEAARASGDGSLEIEVRIRDQQGNERWVYDFTMLVWDSFGTLAHYRGYLFDITDRKEQEKRLLESEERWKFALEGSGDGLWDWWPDLDVIYFSRQWKAILGWEDQEIENNLMVWERLVHPDDLDRVNADVEQHLNGLTPFYQCEHRLLCKDGSYKWVLDRGKVMSKPGEPVRLIGVHTDITERRQAEEAIRQARSQMTAILDNLPYLAWLKDKDGRFLIVNQAFAKACGYPIEAIIGRTDYDIWPAEIAEKYRQDDEETMAKGEQKYVEEMLADPQGAYWVETFKTPIFDINGNLIGTTGLARDITERKRIDEERQDSFNRLTTILNSLDQIIYIADMTTYEILFLNQAGQKAYGGIVGRKCWQSLHKDQTGPCDFCSNHMLVDDAGNPTGVHVWDYRSTINGRWYQNRDQAVRWTDGRLVRMQASTDITESILAREELERAKEDAERANLSKSEFLANMSHEIRTPMNAIIGMAELLQDTELNPEQRKYVQTFRFAGETLLVLINDIIDLSKVETGHLKLEPVVFDLREVVEQACDVMSLRAHEKGLELTVHIQKGTPDCLIGDPGRLAQVLLNLVGNAIKFTEVGEVAVRVRVEPREGGNDCTPAHPCVIHFEVSDTGIGIAPEKQEIIFDQFSQADSSITRQYGGSGLGLTISRRLVRLMGGDLWVESKPWEGSTFFFNVEFPAAESYDRVQQPGEALRGCRVLIVDDNETNRTILTETLRGWGMSADQAGDADQGLRLIEQAAAQDHPYDLVLLDYCMPGMDGAQMLSRMKADSGFSRVIVMMLTSDARAGYQQQWKELGAAGTVVKPVKRKELLRALEAAFSSSDDCIEGTAPEPNGELKGPLRILLVEDSPDNRMLIKAYLKAMPYQIDEAENGEVAVTMVQTQKYHLVLMDMQMPVMDGYTATRAIRKWEKDTGAAAVPIIALTAFALNEDEGKSMAAGCTAYLTKPIKRQALLDAISAYIA